GRVPPAAAPSPYTTLFRSSGGLHPRVIPAPARAATSFSKVCPAVSTKVSFDGFRPRARTRKAAICPRVRRWSGQKRSFVGGLHPDRKSTRLNSSHVKISYA